MFLAKGVLKICSKYTGAHQCRSEISISLLCSFIKIALWHVCSPVNLLYFLRTPFPKNMSGGFLLSKNRSLEATLLSYNVIIIFCVSKNRCMGTASAKKDLISN